MLHASETWPLTKPCLQRLQRNDRTMIRQICNVKPQDTATIRSIELLARLGIEDLDLILKERRLLWYGHVERSNGAVKTAFDIQVDGKRGPERPKMTWKQLTERDRREWKLSAIDPHDRDTWGSDVRSAMCAASQLPGRGPTVVDMALYLHINQKSDDDDDVENKCEECACKSIYVNRGNKTFSILILQFSFNIVFHAILSKLILIRMKVCIAMDKVLSSTLFL